MLRHEPDRKGAPITRTSHDLVVDDAGLAELRTPRDDLVGERADGDDRFVLDHGPFERYERTLIVAPAPEGRHRVTESFAYQLALPVWSVLFALPMRLGLYHRRTPWWAPPDRLDARAARVMALLACIQIVDGYLGTVISQTITFAADEFDRGDTAQGVTLAVIRLGVLVALGVMFLADRKGRRRLLLATATAAVLFTALGALGGSQLFARGLTTGMGILIGVYAAEELPRGARAYGLSVLALAAALGAGMAVWVLPVADLHEAGWRIVYVVPLLSLFGLAAVGRRLPESRRFEANMPEAAPHDRDGAAKQPGIEHRRLLLLAAVAFLFLVFAAPASQFQNDFLKDHRGFTASGITLYTILTTTPAGIGIFMAGRLADTRGRRGVASIGLLGGTAFLVASYYATGGLMWGAHLVGVVVGSLTVAMGTGQRPHRHPRRDGPRLGPAAGGLPERPLRQLRPRLRNRRDRPAAGSRTGALALPRDGEGRTRGPQPRRRPDRLRRRNSAYSCASQASTASATASSAPFRSWRFPVSHTVVTGPGIDPRCSANSSGEPNGSRSPETNRHGTSIAGKWSTRRFSGLSGGCSG